MQLTPLLASGPLALAVPLLLLATGLIPTRWANAHPRRMAWLNITAAWFAFAGAVLVALLSVTGADQGWRLVSLPLPGDLGTFTLSSYVNAVTVIMLLLVSFVAVIVSRYSRNYLDGEINQGRFHKWLSLTLAAILILIVSGNLLMFALAWIATSLCLHQLLMFYAERPAAVLAAHKKFVASRLGEACLLGAVFLVQTSLGTLDFDALYARMADFQGPLPLELHWAAALIVTAAALKSAQFPFHGWLIQVMEAPTPVSALLHAGIVNAGAFLVIRMSPVVSYSPGALGLLAVVGLITLAVAALVMLTQTSVKVSLAWSTTAQMGFMLLECGLGLYSLAMLHLLAHSLYKAHAFLASGSTVDGFRAPSLPPCAGPLPAWRKGAAVGLALTMTLLIGSLFALDVAHQPALLAVGAIVAIATTQLLLQAFSLVSHSAFLMRALGLSLLVCTSYFSLHHLIEWLLRGSMIPTSGVTTVFEQVLVGVVILVFAGLLWVQQLLKSGRPALREALYVHLYNGFYIDVYLTRVLERVWPAPANSASFHGGKA